MIIDDIDYLVEAQQIIEGTSRKQPTILHLRALVLHHQDALIVLANKVGLLQHEIMEME